MIDDFMALQETGGDGETSVPIGARHKPTSRTPPGKWPGALLKKPKHFIGPIESGSDQMVLWRRRNIMIRFEEALTKALVSAR